MIHRFKYYFHFLARALREEGLKATGARLSDFLRRRSFGFGLVLEWLDYQFFSRSRHTPATVISIIDPGNSLKKVARWALYCSFDHNSKISQHVLSQLSFLKGHGFSVLFISSSPELGPEAQALLSPLCAVIIHRKNMGHDFGSWRTGYDLIRPFLDRTTPVILMNDSCFGPYSSLDALFKLLEDHPNSVIGVTKNYLIEEHIQSYFLGFGAETVRAGIFDEYMNRIRLLATKEGIVRFFEIGGSHFLRKRDVPLKALIDPIDKPVASMIQEFGSDDALKDPMGRALVERGLMPFYKRSNGAPLNLPLVSA